ncbi:MAG: hypothetical protein DRJ42_25075, partial [Deltaproteobacteria bacterium]
MCAGCGQSTASPVVKVVDRVPAGCTSTGAMKSTLALAVLLFGSVVGACGGDGTVPVDASMDGSFDGTVDSAVDGQVGVCEGVTDGTSCGVGAFCIGGVCTAGRCGDGVLESDAGEQCDDGANGDDGDGCRDDCTFTCEADVDCDDGDSCTGVESCDIALHLCSTSGPLDCDDLDPCTIDSCDAGVGCAHDLDDGDLDGYAPATTCTTAGLMGGDCDDTNDSVFPGAPEHCDSLDNDCDGAIDEGLATLICLRDADRDRYGDPTDTVNACSCPSGYVGVRADGETDCSDREPDAYPGQPAYFVDGYCP